MVEPIKDVEFPPKPRSIYDGSLKYIRSIFLTLKAFYIEPSILVANSLELNAEDIVPPIQFLVASFAIFAVPSKLIGFDPGEFELPSQAKFLSKILGAVPWFDHNTLVLTVILLSVFLSFAVFKAIKCPVKLRPMLNMAAYCAGATSISATPIILLMFVWITFFKFGFVIHWLGTLVLLPSVFYSYYWLPKAFLEAFSIRRAVSFFVLLGCTLFINVPITLGIPAASSFLISSESMLPTLKPGDIVVANRWVYYWQEPDRGDVVVAVVKRGGPVAQRLVGLPGDKIQFWHGDLYLNDARPPSQKIQSGSIEFDMLGFSTKLNEFIEYLAPGVGYRTYKADPQSAYAQTRMYKSINDTPIYRVPPGHYFLLGDNRDEAVDSRVPNFLGFVPRNAILGKLYSRFLPLNDPFNDGLYKPERHETSK